MAIIVAKPKAVSASIRVANVNNVFVPKAQTPITLDTVTTGGATRLDQLSDVQEGTPANNFTLIYNSSTDTYNVQEMNLDGGTF
jgi:hypothetical protein